MAECRRRAADEPDLASSDSVDVERPANCANEEDETSASGGDKGRGARVLKISVPLSARTPGVKEGQALTSTYESSLSEEERSVEEDLSAGNGCQNPVDTVLAGRHSAGAKGKGATTSRTVRATHKVDSAELLEDVQGNAAEMSSASAMCESARTAERWARTRGYA